MKLESILPIGISLISLAGTTYTFLKNRKIAEAQVELQIHTKIVDSKKDINKFIYESNKNDKKIKILIMESLIENELNTYEEACNKYLDNKIDKKRFRKSYLNEIQALFNAQSTKGKLTDYTSKYNAIRKVNEEWNNLKKRNIQNKAY
ncbi:hypothetical protein [Cetobacterium sp.]|uniref:hypothetical protein n=1 Tax=Cetobacterium sp. TaxID=2071632 RepID=UPI002FC80BE5